MASNHQPKVIEFPVPCVPGTVDASTEGKYISPTFKIKMQKGRGEITRDYKNSVRQFTM